VETPIILLAVPFSAVGAIWLLYLLGYNTSIAVWVGLIALLGVDAETGVFMLLYLNIAFDERRRRGQMRSRADLKGAIIEGAVQRLRPKVMTVGVMFMGLLPIMWSHGTGADVMKRIAAPMIGGIFTSFIMELLVYRRSTPSGASATSNHPRLRHPRRLYEDRAAYGIGGVSRETDTRSPIDHRPPKRGQEAWGLRGSTGGGPRSASTNRVPPTRGERSPPAPSAVPKSSVERSRPLVACRRGGASLGRGAWRSAVEP